MGEEKRTGEVPTYDRLSLCPLPCTVALRLDDSRVLTFQLRAYFTSKYFILQQFGCVL